MAKAPGNVAETVKDVRRPLGISQEELAYELGVSILTIKKGNTAHSKISDDGKEAISHIEPLMMEGERTKIKVSIDTGRTHQIRVHLKSIGASILGDTEYGGRPYKRMMLHASKIELLGYSLKSKEPEDFIKFAL